MATISNPFSSKPMRMFVSQESMVPWDNSIHGPWTGENDLTPRIALRMATDHVDDLTMSGIISERGNPAAMSGHQLRAAALNLLIPL